MPENLPELVIAVILVFDVCLCRFALRKFTAADHSSHGTTRGLQTYTEAVSVRRGECQINCVIMGFDMLQSRKLLGVR